jgi:hypothetical protein
MKTFDMAQLSQLLWQQCTGTASDWLQSATHQLKLKSDDSEALFELYLRYSAMAKRKLGVEVLVEPLVEVLADDGHWHVDEVARLVLLDQLLFLTESSKQPSLVKAAFKFGDESEQIAIIKGLNLLPSPHQLVDLAIATGRTNSVNLFAAIALNNDFANVHYSEAAYHQLVLKALFIDLDISQMVGLKAHHCQLLSGLAIDLVNERLAAGRQPPGGIWLAIDQSHLHQQDLETFKRFNP